MSERVETQAQHVEGAEYEKSNQGTKHEQKEQSMRKAIRARNQSKGKAIENNDDK